MTIAVIDDGVNAGFYPNIGKLVFDLKVDERNRVVHRRRYNPLKPSHGTTCASIIQKYAPNTQLGSIKILSDETKKGNPKQLIAALNWCSENGIKLVHMSIGSRHLKDMPLIAAAVQSLLDKGCIIVAALANTMKYSAPANLENVLGVRTSSILKDDQYLCDDGGLLSTPFVASSLHKLTDYTGNMHITQFCNSYAAPLITAKVCQLLEKDKDLTIPQVRKRLGGRETMRSYLNLLKETPLLTNTVDIPIICVDGKKKDARKVAEKLNQLFLSAGYSCMAFCEGEQEENSLTSIPQDTPIQKLFSFYANHLELDLIVFVSKDSPVGDAWIHLSPTARKNRYDGDDVTIPKDFSDGQIKSVMRYVEKGG